MQEARASDALWFRALGRRLQRRGLLARGPELEVFVSLPHVALGVTQQRQALGARFDETVRLVVEALAQRLGAPRRSR
jgi:hypothetical protein